MSEGQKALHNFLHSTNMQDTGLILHLGVWLFLLINFVSLVHRRDNEGKAGRRHEQNAKVAKATVPQFWQIM